MDQPKKDIPKAEVPPEVLASMWQFFLKTSVPRIIAEHERAKKEQEKNDDLPQP